MEQSSKYLKGEVLDFGSGSEPYKDIVVGNYTPYDTYEHRIYPTHSFKRLVTLPVGPFDTVICNQVLQYIDDPIAKLKQLYDVLKPGGHLVMTYPVSWDEVESTDLWRFTKAGMERMLFKAGLVVIQHDRRAEINLDGFKFPLGYGVVAKKLCRHNTLTEDESVLVLIDKLQNEEPFTFLRYGDGALECIYGLGAGRTCDQEFYSPELGCDLKEVWDKIINHKNTYIGDWQSASFNAARSGEYPLQYADLIGDAKPHWLHFESLLLMRESEVLVDFYKTIAADKRKKVFMGPACMIGAAKMLRCEHHIVTPMQNLHASVDILEGNLKTAMRSGFEVVLYGAGMAGTIPIVRTWEEFPNGTYINLGSAMDPLFRGQTRTVQLKQSTAKRLFRDLLQ